MGYSDNKEWRRKTIKKINKTGKDINNSDNI